ncbi:unnamed protein product [Somion occarium]|uniref:t-SNARE coiled-coil homology domain-containing protein n=1 Tax=Somion occarium TaxID=3059160 RepID=A0ABP1CJN1_9APHY
MATSTELRNLPHLRLPLTVIDTQGRMLSVMSTLEDKATSIKIAMNSSVATNLKLAQVDSSTVPQGREGHHLLESVNSTRNALRLAREAEETARGTLGRLGDQSEKLANTERHLDVSKGHSQRAEDKADELKQLNRSIFRPVITFNKDAKRAAQEAKIQQRYEDEREEREKAMLDIRETQERVGRAVTYGRRDDDEGIGGRYKTEAQLNARKDQRKRFQFDATASDDELEDELDDNLGEISDMTKRLKAIGTSMGQELDKQNERIGRITEKTDSLDNRIFRNTKKLERIK